MATTRRRPPGALTPRTIRFPERLRQRVGADAERCGRSFDAQVIAILRRHYGEDVDLAPTPDQIIGTALNSLSGLSAAEIRKVTRRLDETRDADDADRK